MKSENIDLSEYLCYAMRQKRGSFKMERGNIYLKLVENQSCRNKACFWTCDIRWCWGYVWIFLWWRKYPLYFSPNKDLEETKKKCYCSFIYWSTAWKLGNWVKRKWLIGSIDLTQAVIRSSKKAAIGYVIHKNYWNQGLATEALKEIIQLASWKLLIWICWLLSMM